MNNSAGDIVYDKPFENFILELDYKVPADANSGIMSRVSEDQGTIWATGIEFQLLDNTDPHGDSEKAGWAYALYKPADDPKTGKPLDATQPIGHWNHVKIVYDGPHVEHWMNGVKYCEFETRQRRFQAAGPAQQVRGHAAVRQEQVRPDRLAGRSRQRELCEHQDQGLAGKTVNPSR